jgi:hypothetical protein
MVEKAYVMACLSEGAYLHLTEREVPDHDRYKIFPSIIQWELIRRRWRMDASRIFRRIIEEVATLEIIEIGQFIYTVYAFSDFVVTAVRGTRPKSFEDWIINLNAIKSGTFERNYHRGFFREAKKAEPALKETLARIGRDRARLYFTGHSMGGAVAAILSSEWNSDQPVMTPYLFASPRYAMASVVRDKPPYGYIASNDMVPHVPPRRLGFADAGRPPELLCPGQSQLSGLRTLIHWATPGNGFARPHSMELYRYEIGRRAGETKAYSPNVYVTKLPQVAEKIRNGRAAKPPGAGTDKSTIPSKAELRFIRVQNLIGEMEEVLPEVDDPQDAKRLRRALSFFKRQVETLQQPGE